MQASSPRTICTTANLEVALSPWVGHVRRCEDLQSASLVTRLLMKGVVQSVLLAKPTDRLRQALV
jgi:hypothetical protein